MDWWFWLVAGLILVALEMAASGGFYVIFFGIAAILIGTLRLFDVAGPAWFQFFLFSVLSIGSLMLFRKPILRWMQLDRAGTDVDTLIGETAVPIEDIAPGAVGRAELRGTLWTARNAGPAVVSRGQRCTVVRVEQLTIFLTPEGVSR